MTFASINAHHFMGKNGFNWFVGVVEDNQDDLGLGRARVRIFGTHNEDPAVLPTESLPWAYALAPLDNADAPMSPPVSSWVLGFFLDGEIAQQPVMLGVLVGNRYKEVLASDSSLRKLLT